MKSTDIIPKQTETITKIEFLSIVYHNFLPIRKEIEQFQMYFWTKNNKRKYNLIEFRKKGKRNSFVALFLCFIAVQKNKFWSQILFFLFSFVDFLFLLLQKKSFIDIFSKWTCHKHIFCQFVCQLN